MQKNAQIHVAMILNWDLPESFAAFAALPPLRSAGSGGSRAAAARQQATWRASRRGANRPQLTCHL